MKETIIKLAQDGNESTLLELLVGTRFYYDAIKEAAKFNHTLLVNKLFKQLNFDPYNVVSMSIGQLALLNNALEGYTSGLHFDHVKQMVSLGGNIFYGLNALVSEDLLTPENALKLIDCAKDEVQKTALCDRIEQTFDIPCHQGTEPSEIRDTSVRVNH